MVVQQRPCDTNRSSASVIPVLDTPWKVFNDLYRRVIYPYTRLLFAVNRIPWHPSWRFHGAPIIQKHRQSIMRFGPRMRLRSSIRSNPLGPTHPVILCTWQPGAVLEIGTDFGMTGGSVVAAQRITIGDRVTVGANCTIIDTDFHPLESKQRQLHPQDAEIAPVVIEDDVFIGMNCLILKGITLGRGSVIGAGSVVTRDVPPYSVVAGNPAQIIRTRR